jgi:DNA helicase-2/ATP-dependent DNA helicase PcrA
VENYKKAYKELNAKQREAVDTIFGPVLVIAGPGTGKTQLLSMRVANIIKTTDTAPNNILCLTFTDNAARNMRERLESIIGQTAYHVGINTFHSFGGEIINQFPDYFSRRQLLQQVDELGQYELLKNIFEGLPHSNPLSTKVGEDFIHLKNTLSVISWLKQNGIASHELHEIINSNKKFIDLVSKDLAKAFKDTPSSKNLPAYNEFLNVLQKHRTGQKLYGFPDYGTECIAELEQAIAETSESGRYAPKITAWRNKWCQKNAAGENIFKDAGQNIRKMHALANIYQKLVEDMAEQGLYDFDDMVVEVVHTLEQNDELRLTLQERYQFILVDEFQDTNKAQLRLLSALGDNPINEGRPNIMVVGDDDQAIYAFQGAEVSNMVAFSKMFRKPTLITLQDNYRSTKNVLDVSFAVAEQINDRLESILPGTHKELTVQARHDQDVLEHSVFSSELSQYDFIGQQVSTYIEKGIKPENIAIIAPRHKYLERLVPYLASRQIPIAYERRENILDSPVINQLLTMAKLVVAISKNQHAEVDLLLSQVLGYDFWNIEAEVLLEISMDCYNTNKRWLYTAAKHEDEKVSGIANWFMRLAKKSSTEPMEYVLDQLTGVIDDGIDSEFDELVLPDQKVDSFISPLREFYFSAQHYEQATDSYLAFLGQLSTLRHRLRHWKPHQALYIKDLVEFAQLHTNAQIKIIDTNPHTQTTNAVQVMTAYKAKGLEFDVVFLINAQDEIWGPTAKSRISTITLPKNLPIAPASGGDNDKLRLLFVALTRAKKILHITSYTHTMDNKLSPGLSFIGGNSEDSQPVHPSLKTQMVERPTNVQSAEILATDWAYKFRQIIASKSTLFEPILKNYKLSATHLNNFIDIKDSGPQYFFIHNLLRFPEAVSPAAAYGDAVHKTLQWAQFELRQKSKLPDILDIQNNFSYLMGRKHLRETDFKKLDERGREAIERFILERGSEMSATDIVERGFNNEGVVIDGAVLSGKVDKLVFNEAGQAHVVDFKTGKPAKSWQGRDEYEKVKLHKYQQQLMFYKILVENSASYGRRTKVASGALEFIEPDETSKLVSNLEIEFDPEELQRFIKLIGAVWQRIQNLDFPDTSKYPSNLTGIKAFENDLLTTLD